MRIDIPVQNIEKTKEVILYVLKKIGHKSHVDHDFLCKLLYF